MLSLTHTTNPHKCDATPTTYTQTGTQISHVKNCYKMFLYYSFHAVTTKCTWQHLQVNAPMPPCTVLTIYNLHVIVYTQDRLHDLHTICPNGHHWWGNPWSVVKLLSPSSHQGALEGRGWATSYWAYFGTAAVPEQTHLTLPATLSTVHNQMSESHPTATLSPELLPAAAVLLPPAVWFGSSLPCLCEPPGYARVVMATILPSACHPVSHQAGFAAMENISLLAIRFGTNAWKMSLNTQTHNTLM